MEVMKEERIIVFQPLQVLGIQGIMLSVYAY